MSDGFIIRDIPIQVEVSTRANKETGVITQRHTVVGKIPEEMIHTKSEQLKQALIELGWTPPPEDV